MEKNLDVVKLEEVSRENNLYKDSTYDLISKIAYLIGVPKRIFQKEHEAPRQEIFEQLEKEKNGRIIRHLCVCRTAIERNYKNINDKMAMEYRSLWSLTEYIPMESLQQLNEDGIDFIKKGSTRLNHHIVEINRIISDRINNCKSFFPLWLNWQYVRDLFLMPNGLTPEGTKQAAAVYYAHRLEYPYQVYINWIPGNDGNILYNDKKFVTLLYQQHGDTFTEYSKVSDAADHVKGSIYDFINEGKRIVFVVDCENSDPYKLCAVLRGLRREEMDKIEKIILFDDVHTATTWRILENFTHVPVEHTMIERIKQNKSLVDITLTARACREYYENCVDSFIMVSSDSDYWGLISSLPSARFLVMIEHEKCGPDMKTALVKNGIFYCYMDDFFSGDIEELKRSALFKEMNRYLEQAVSLNARDMFEEALRVTRMQMTEAERRQFFEKHIRNMMLVMDENGDVRIELKR